MNKRETVAVVSKKIRVTAHTYYSWRKEYDGRKVDQARWLEELEQKSS